MKRIVPNEGDYPRDRNDNGLNSLYEKEASFFYRQSLLRETAGEQTDGAGGMAGMKVLEMFGVDVDGE